MTDGPYAETTEQMGGVWVIEADDFDAAATGVLASGRHAAAQRLQDLRMHDDMRSSVEKPLGHR